MFIFIPWPLWLLVSETIFDSSCATISVFITPYLLKTHNILISFLQASIDEVCTKISSPGTKVSKAFKHDLCCNRGLAQLVMMI